MPVLLVHGALDDETPPEHSEQIGAALARPGELRLVPDAGHNDVMGKAWPGIEAWLAALFPRETALLALP